MSEWVCGYRETRIDGTWECVAAPGHDTDTKHYLIRLVQTVARDEP